MRRLVVALVVGGLLGGWSMKSGEVELASVYPEVDLARYEPSSRGGRPAGILMARPVGLPTRTPTAVPTVAPTTTAIPSPTPQSTRQHLGTFKVTFYSLRGITRSGQYVRPGVVAVDPRIIPLGTVIEVEGLGTYTALDTGGGVLGNWLDIWVSSYDEAISRGVQYRSVWR